MKHPTLHSPEQRLAALEEARRTGHIPEEAHAGPLPMRESDLQRLIVDYLERVVGCTVVQTGAWRRRSRCPACGHQFHAGGGHSTPGSADLYAFHRALGGSWCAGEARPLWIGLELKIPGGRLSPAQLALAELGATRIVRSLEDVQQVLMECGMPVSIGTVP